MNGLAILNEVADLDEYYRERVIVGPGAFVTAAADFEHFAEAFQRKLIREIEDAPPLAAAGDDMPGSAVSGTTRERRP